MTDGRTRGRSGGPWRRIAASLLALVLAVPAAARDPAPAASPAPEAATGLVAKPPAVARRHMVVAAHPLAVEAGLAILAAGGGAVDAAIATQLVLGVVEPQSSGLGGGGFLLHYEAATGTVTTIDGRETAPATTPAELFLDADGKPLPFFARALGGRAVGVPGLPMLLAAAHRRHGRLPWADLVAPALRLAEAGFTVTPRLAALLLAARERLAAEPASASALLGPAGLPLLPGQPLRRPDLAATLRTLSEGGVAPFYYGAIAAEIAAAAARPPNPGHLTPADFARYTVDAPPPLCTRYRGHRVCGMGPPSSGGAAVAQILGMLEPFALEPLDPRGAPAAHLLIEAGRRAFADRARHLGDPRRLPLPVEALVDPAYLAGRARTIDPARATPEVAAGTPPRDGGETTHLSVVDSAGNAVALTSSIEMGFGSHRMAAGLLLNNQLTDFDPLPPAPGVEVNLPGPGWRPRSSMAPTLVFAPDGRLLYVLGSPGGSAIIGYVVRALTGLVDWRLTPDQAAALPHALGRGPVAEIEDPALAPALEALGHRVAVGPQTSGLNIIERRPEGLLLGGADPRREGIALGE